MSGQGPNAARAHKRPFAYMPSEDPTAHLPLEAEVDCEDLGAKYARDRYAAATVARDRTLTARYEKWCAANGRAAYSDSVGPAAAYLARVRGRGTYVGIVKTAICRGYEAAGFPNPATDASLVRLVEGVKRSRPAKPLRAAVTVRQLVAVLETLDPDAPTDARAGSLLLHSFASGLPIRQLLQADRERTRADADGVVLGLRHGTHWVSCGSAPLTCPAWWTARWLGHLGRTAGPLFVTRRARGGWNEHPMTLLLAQNAIWTAWRRAHPDVPPPGFRALRRSFALAGLRVASKVVVAHQLRVRSMRDMREGMHLPGIGADDHWGRTRRRNGARTR